MVVDVDEVLGMFMRGFESFLVGRGYEMRITRFALFQNIYRPGAAEHLDVATGRSLFEEYFASDCEHMEVTPGAVDALGRLSKRAGIVILTNAPGHGREPRARWLARHGLHYPLVIGSGPKGAPVAALNARTQGPVAFIDDLLPNLDSVAADAPDVSRFQHVADERLRPLAFTAPERHARIDDWPTLGAAVEAAIRR
ncbi:MAG TPA: hypothetical protein VG939_06750 [Caulobacteraceae bacterium]|nr:hypothetical protein [Caulobacteraceae bacterium]